MTAHCMAHPFLKCPGGKSWLAPVLAAEIARYRRYIEPFLGGGAVALAVRAEAPAQAAILADANPLLIAAWWGVQRDAGAVAAALAALRARGEDRATYLAVRDEVRRSAGTDAAADAAARAIYLNRICFNGLWRVNAAGGFNTPYGDGKPRGWPSAGDLAAVGAALRGVAVRRADFRDVIAEAGEGDCLYADPPYWGVFSQYTAAGFGEADHRDLAEALAAAAARGATVIASNRDTGGVREAYAWARVEPVGRWHRIGAKAPRRKDGIEVLIASPGEVLDRLPLPSAEVVRPDFASKRAALDEFRRVNADVLGASEFYDVDRCVAPDVIEGLCRRLAHDRAFRTFRQAFYAAVGGRRWEDVDVATLREATGLPLRGLAREIDDG